MPQPEKRSSNFLASDGFWQISGLVVAWIYVVSLHWPNDGLSYAGDAARHAANGLFWGDFLRSLPRDPTEFALSYYARYPVINPTSYPPVFYLIEAAAFAVFGPSPFVAKGLVLTFALVAGVYVTLWARRWLAKEAGWAGMLMMLQPGIIVWSNVVMLNIPAMTLNLAALYHGRRALDAPDSKQVYVAAVIATLAFMTYYTAVIVWFVFAAWIVVERRWRIFRTGMGLAIGLSFVLTFWAALYVVRRGAPLHLSLLFPTLETILLPSYWTYYAQKLPKLVSPSILVFCAVGAAVAIFDRRRGGEAWMVLVWAIVCYLGLSALPEREGRYALSMVPAVMILAAVGLLSFARVASIRFGGTPSRAFLASVALLIGISAGSAWAVRVPRVSGIQEIVAYLNENAPHERLFYDGTYDGIFTYYARASDPGLTRGVVRGGKLLYASAIFPQWRLTERAASVADVIEAFRNQCGCRWVAIERERAPSRIAAAQHLRKAVSGPEFQLVKSFVIEAGMPTRVDLYRFLPPIHTPSELEIPVPVLGEGTVFRAKPLDGKR